MIKEYEQFILANAPWAMFYPGIDEELAWAIDNALVIEQRDEQGELRELSFYVATSYLTTKVSDVIDNIMGANDPKGEFLLCGIFVKHKDLHGTPIRIMRYKKQWLAKYPNVKELCYKAQAHDGKLVRVKIRT